MVHPRDVIVYIRIRLFDVVRVICGPYVGKIGRVHEIHGCGYFTIQEIVDRRPKMPLVLKDADTGKITRDFQFLSIYRTDLEIHDRLYVGDSVRFVDHGPQQHTTAIVKEIRENGEVNLEQVIGSRGTRVRMRQL